MFYSFKRCARHGRTVLGRICDLPPLKRRRAKMSQKFKAQVETRLRPVAREADVGYSRSMTTMCFSLKRGLVLAGILLVPSAQFLRADQIEMKNGDRYVGTVLSMTADSVVLQSQMLGKVVVPRSKVSLISLGMA